MSSPIHISAVIITFNEQKNIARCIQSLVGIADEIVVVDSFSTDQTVNIATDLGAKVIQNAWQGYSQQKNFGNEKAQFQWILSLDADEAISNELKTNILKIKTNTTADGYYISRLTNYCGHWIKYGDWYPDQKLRLWNKAKGQWQGLIHEVVSMSVAANTATLKGDILHYSYYSIMEHVAQMNKFTEIMAEDNALKNKKASLVKIICSPPVKFIKGYFIKLGFLDGFYGFVVAAMSAHATFLKYCRTRELQKHPID